MFLTKRSDLKSRKHRRRLLLESLESRALLTAVPAPIGMVSWWSANGNGSDTMGMNNAALVNGTAFAAGEVGNAFSFDGVNDSVALGDPSSLAFTGSFSIEGWVKVNALNPNSNFQSILFRGDNRGGLDPYQLVVLPSGNLQFGITGTNGGASIQAPIQTGQLVHVAATLDDATGEMKLYENGVVVAKTTTVFRPFGALDPTQNPGVGIGNSNYVPNYNVPFNGLIDELSVYNRALTPGEVLGIAKAGSSGKVFSPIAVDSPSIIEGATGTTIPITFTIQRTDSLTGPLTVAWAIADDTATAGSDYVAASGSVTFADGQSLQTVTIVVNGDNTVEPTETFKLVLTPTGGTPVMGLGKIVTDDASISITSTSVTEGDKTIQALDAFGGGGLNTPKDMVFGPNGDLFVASFGTNSILRYDATSGTFLNAFVLPGAGGLVSPHGLAFGPDGNLYVSSFSASSQILRFDGTSGAYIDTFVPVGSGGLTASAGIAFGPDGSLLVSSRDTNQVLQFQGPAGANPGAFAGVFASTGTDSLPQEITVGPDGNVYVSCVGKPGIGIPGFISRYSPDGVSLGTFVAGGSGGMTNPRHVAFDSQGTLYVADLTLNAVLRYQGPSGISPGAFIDTYVSSRLGGLTSPIGAIFGVDGNLFVSSRDTNQVLRYGVASQATLTVSLSSAIPGQIIVNYSTADGTAIAGSDYIVASGMLTFAPGETTKTIVVPTLDDAILEPNEFFTVNLVNAIGGSVAVGQGTVTILDNDAPPTKFYVVNDGSSDRTYEYGATGNSVENYTINSGNSTPRGAASTAAGDKVWVVDANRNVYVYNTSGGLLGSWTAGSMSTTAQPEGITTNGTDVWIVDYKSDKVFKYAGAASRLSGSQTAVSTFNLNSGNTSPKDLVTDGTSIWVVNDSSTDKVFKYSIGGTLLGSWTINAGGGSPTGITLDPSNASQSLWIVDSNSDKVYEYVNARGIISGSQAASVTFALASGNSNAQGIADPPVGADRSASPTASNTTLGQNVKETYSTVMMAPVNRANSDLRVPTISDVQRPDRGETIDSVRAFTVLTTIAVEHRSRPTSMDPSGSVGRTLNSHDYALLEVLRENGDEVLSKMIDSQVTARRWNKRR